MANPTSASSVLNTVTTTTLYSIPQSDPSLCALEHVNVKCDNGTKYDQYRLVSRTSNKLAKDYLPTLVKPEFFEEIRKNNPFSDMRIREKNLQIRGINSVEVDPGLGLVWVSLSSHTLLDSELRPLPFSHNFDYTGSLFSTRHINLTPKLQEFLRSHPWVVNKDDLSPRLIPYYNNDSGSEMYIPVTILPDQKTYGQIWSYYGSEKYPSCRVRDSLTGKNVLWSNKEPDWFGIRPWLIEDGI